MQATSTKMESGFLVSHSKVLCRVPWKIDQSRVESQCPTETSQLLSAQATMLEALDVIVNEHQHHLHLQ